MHGDPIARPESPVEKIPGEAGHRGVEFGIRDAPVSRPNGGFARLPFGVVLEGAIHCHELILMLTFGEGKQ